MNRHPLLAICILLATLSMAMSNEDHRILICQQACLKVAGGDSTMSKEEIDERIELASRFAQQCSNKCTDLYMEGDSMETIVERLHQIPFKELFSQQ